MAIAALLDAFDKMSGENTRPFEQALQGIEKQTGIQLKGPTPKFSLAATHKERRLVTIQEFEAWAMQVGLGKNSPEVHALIVLAIAEQVFLAEEERIQAQEAAQTPEEKSFFQKVVEELAEIDADALARSKKLLKPSLDSKPFSVLSILQERFKFAFNAVLLQLSKLMAQHQGQPNAQANIMQSVAYQAYLAMMPKALKLFPDAGVAGYVDQKYLNTFMALQAFPKPAVSSVSPTVTAVPQVPYVPGGSPAAQAQVISNAMLNASWTANSGAGGGANSGSRAAANAAAQQAQQQTYGASRGMGPGSSSTVIPDAPYVSPTPFKTQPRPAGTKKK